MNEKAISFESTGPAISPVVLLLGPSETAVSGITTHLKQLMASTLCAEFSLKHFQVGSQGRRESKLARLVRTCWSPLTLSKEIITSDAKLVHINTSMDQKAFWRDLAYLFAAKLIDRKVVYQIHGGPFPHKLFSGLFPMTSFVRLVLRLPDAVVVLAECERVAYQDFAKIKRLELIPNGIDLEPYEKAVPKDYDGHPIRLAYLGALVRGKGLQDLVKAVAILCKRVGEDKIELHVAGSGSEEAKLKNIVDGLGLGHVVKFVGPIFGGDKIRFWMEAGIFVLPTLSEGLPYSVLESMASGTPVVTTSVGGIPDIVTDGRHGVFIEPDNPEGIADAIETLLFDRKRLKEMSLRCVERARQFYGVDRMAQQMKELYRRVLGTS